MKFHIISDGESLDDIINAYNLSAEEIKKENKHIRVWAHLIPGTKLKIPVISDAISQDLNDIEPFIEDYYPKLKINIPEEEKIEAVDIPLNEEKTTEEVETNSEELSETYSSPPEFQETNDQKITGKIEEAVKEQFERPVVQKPVQYVPFYPYPAYRPIIYVIPRYRKY